MRNSFQQVYRRYNNLSYHYNMFYLFLLQKLGYFCRLLLLLSMSKFVLCILLNLFLS